MADLLSSFRSARRVSAPLLLVRTTDPAATLAMLAEKAPNRDKPICLVRWDCNDGLQPIDKFSSKLMAEGAPGPNNSKLPPVKAGGSTVNPTEALTLIQHLGEESCVFMLNAHRFFSVNGVIQGVWNLRDRFKADLRTLVMIAPFGQTLPRELDGDVVVLDDPLPTPEQLKVIVQDTCASVDGMKVAPLDLERAVDALAGLPAFSAEQATAMCIRKSGIDMDGLWERKRQAIEQTRGLRVWRPTRKFNDIGGCENIKAFTRGVVIDGEALARARAIAFVDEIEKQVGSAGGNDGGVSQAIHGKLLSGMSDTDSAGMLLVGHPGTCKSEFVKALALEAGIPAIVCDFGSVKEGLVGSSEANMDRALATIEAVGQGRVLFVATCNSVANLSTELRRRFTFGTYFFDLPTAQERAAIWAIYAVKPHKLATGPLTAAQQKAKPDDANWTGAEIKQCCELAWRMKCTLKQAATYVVPISQAMPERINKLRHEANGRYISASAPGMFSIDDKLQPLGTPDAGEAWAALPGGKGRTITGVPES